MVPEAGLEPAQAVARGILSPLRLPIPPLRHMVILAFSSPVWQAFLLWRRQKQRTGSSS